MRQMQVENKKVYFLKVLTLIMTLRKLCEDVGQVCISGS